MIIKRFLVLATLCSLGFSLQATSSVEDCAAITDDIKRLKCYDTFLKTQKSSQQEQSVQPQKSAEKESIKTEALITESVETPAASSQATKPSQPELTAEDRFGAEQIEDSSVNADELDLIKSRAIGLFKSWEKGMEIKLENDQVWEITDSRSAYHMIKNPVITIEKGIFDSYLLGVEGLNKRFRVKRIK